MTETPQTNVIEKEWNDYLLNVMPKDASVVQVLNFLDPGTEATETDLAKMDALENELNQFLAKEAS